MANGKEDPEIRQLREIRQELEAIRENTAAKTSFWHGILYGIGWIIGSLVALVLVGWLLSVLGIIPGLNHIVAVFQNAFTQVRR